MTDRPAILLAPPNPSLAAALSPLNVISDPTSFDEAKGPLWAFVDWLLADTSGLEFCRRLRGQANTANAWIVVVLDDTDREVRKRALHAGADDYIIGPLTPEHVVSRLGTGDTRDTPNPTPLAFGGISVNREAFQARAGGKPVPLAPNELNLLAHFLENRDRVITRRELISTMKRSGEVMDERTVDVWIGRLRRGMKASGIELPIRTVRQMGYVFDS